MASVELKRMQQVYGTRAEFTAIDPYLLPAELAIQTTDRIIKFGSPDVKRWSECEEFTLPFANLRDVPPEVINAAKSAYDLYVEDFKSKLPSDTQYTTNEETGVISYSYTPNGESTPVTGTIPTTADWLGSLVGEKGETGATGADGKSAYEVYVDDFKAKLPADTEYTEENGVISYSYTEDGASEATTGTIPTQAEWLAALRGPTGATGKDAYEVYVDDFNAEHADDDPKPEPLTRAAWLRSLIGADGKSAYEIFKTLNPTSELTEAEWIASLKGEDGADALEVLQRTNPELTEATLAAFLKGDQGEKGEPFQIYKTFSSVAALAEEGAEVLADGESTLEPNQFVIVVTEDPKDEDNGKLYIYLGPDETDETTNSHFRFVVDMSVAGVKGETGATGETGADGKSAYQVYLTQFQEDHAEDVVDEEHPAAVPMTQAEWLASLRGPQGEQGIQGEKGEDGEDGKSAYEVYVENFNAEHAEDPDETRPSPMSEADWLESLKGADGYTGPQGKSAYELYVDGYKANLPANTEYTTDAETGVVSYSYMVDGENEPVTGTIPTQAEWLISLKGEDATVTILEDGVVIEHLVGEKVTVMNGKDGEKGDTGATGKSAYEVYVAYQQSIGNVNILSKADWLESLKGEQGIQGAKGDTGAPFHISKTFSTVADLSATDAADLGGGDTLSEGDFVIIATASESDADNGKVYVYLGEDETDETTNSHFRFVVDMSVVGATGIQGPTGKSAYQSAVDTGEFEGTEQEWADHVVNGPAAKIESLRQACYRMKAILEYVAETAHVNVSEALWAALEENLTAAGTATEEDENNG